MNKTAEVNTTTTSSPKKEMKAPLLEEKKGIDSNLGNKWSDSSAKKTYSLWDFTKFTLPFIWKRGWFIRIQTILTFILLILSKVLNVVHPLILKTVIDDITAGTQSETQ